jgi:hypothetical protein
MSTKRQPSKQRRQTLNQRQRAALEARRSNAAAGRVPDGKVGAATGSSGAGAGRSLLSRLRGASTAGRAVRTGGAPTSTSGLPVGHRAAMSAMLAAAAAAAVGSFFIRLPIDRSGEAIGTPAAMVAEWSLSALEEVRGDPSASAEDTAGAIDDWTPGGEEPYAQAAWPLSLGVLLPVVGAGLAFRAVSKRAPAKVVNRTMYVTLFGTLLAAQLLILFLPAVVGVAIAAFQVRKAEVAAQVAASTDDAAADDGADADEVIEVEEAVEDDAFLEAEAEATDEAARYDDDDRDAR